ncbi:DegT/DnrJ/EryC1/StrS family aminotransferase [sulfur-oxidizing endosymbiont of Gigantopelta aegis]|uniref:DegT/DnrJ/EryC1/StrS family aminotransferase n=1 Tax=sulfur-oxidizing endosymbiont of Gigantopelta aegis TaxID=2794934 RepID=UPI0018DAF8FE|nr:DegT/DnrJ/EryC1/StrS family aminotransferase [sulfur-oxidizing endosymbiont of Gigantopelta aegis]
MINVTKTYMPDKAKYLAYVDQIFESGWVTNNGMLVRELEARLADYLGIKNIVLVANGTIALEIAYRLLKLDGEVITTPFSFVATTSSLVSNALKPIFADIDPKTLTLNPDNIEDRITDKTSAIVPVHVFGNACEVDRIQAIAEKNNLKVIYDAAHAFGVQYKGESLLNHGDVSTLSFHATKLFHTIEGGALIINDDSLVEEARYLINFGIDGRDSVKALGTNAKMNEFEAAMGLCVLNDMDKVLHDCKVIYDFYESSLCDILTLPIDNLHSSKNYSYFPALFKSEQQTLDVQSALHENGIYPRRYFYPSLDTLPYIIDAEKMINSQTIASRILALPLYPGLSREEQVNIISIIRKKMNIIIMRPNILK